MELSPTQYAQKLLRQGKTPKQILKILKNNDYEHERAHEIVQHAQAHRAWKKAAYIGLLAVVIPLLAYFVVTSGAPVQTTPAPTSTPAPQTIDPEAVMIQAVASNNASLCDQLTERRQECLAEVDDPDYQPSTQSQRLHAQAQATGNRSLCNDITNQSVKEACLADTQ